MTSPEDTGGGLDRIGPYLLLELLGEGAQGSVYLAEQHEKVRLRVAIKVFKQNLRSRDAEIRFEAERQALARMDHPGIAKFLGAGTTGLGQPYFVMEYVAGMPLNDYCDEHRLGIRERLALFLQLCDAVQHAHHKGVIHRDLKPGNVLVRERNDRPEVKLVDFGLARATDGQLTSKVIFTEDGRVLGTLGYMSPEQADPTRLDIDMRTDVYSLGVVLYELLVGELPFSQEELHDAGPLGMQLIVRDMPPPKPTTRLRGTGTHADDLAHLRRTTTRGHYQSVRRDLEWITLKCLEKDRTRRYATPTALAEDVGRYLDGLPVTAAPPSRVYRLQKWLKRHRRSVAAAAALLLTLLAALATSLVFYRDAEQANTMYRRLEDLVLVRDYQTESTRLFPELPEMADAMRAWLTKVRTLAARLNEHEAALAELADETAGDDGQSRDVAGHRFLRESLGSLVDELRSLRDNTIPAIEKRLQRADTVYEQSVTKYADLWNQTIEAIEADPRFGFRINPQVGLVPLGPDLKSNLQEFAHPRTGEIPVRGPGAKLEITGDTGLVFVLIPGGKYWMGAQRDPNRRNFDEQAAEREAPVHEVELATFFLSKYEMSQAQWKRFTGHNPSYVNPPTWESYCRKAWRGRPSNEVDTLLTGKHLLPVDSVRWDDAHRVFWELGLRLPSEEQWEFAARAGDDPNPWPTGPTPDGLHKHANLADSTAALAGVELPGSSAENDGYPVCAPITEYEANGFGLHNMLGNVAEWVANGYRESYDDEEGKGSFAGYMTFRGGSWYFPAFYARRSSRQAANPSDSNKMTGIRPARSVVQRDSDG